MPSSQNGNIGLYSGYTAGDNGWTAQHNQSWDALDALVQATVKSVTTTTPPASPANGDAYLIPAGATGAWASNTNKIAVWQARTGVAAWQLYAPKNGWQVYNQADGGDYVYNGSAWALQGSPKLNVPQDYVSGLIMSWNSATSISVSTGAAYVLGLGRLSQVGATLTLSGLALSASTFYHVYLYESAGTPTIECVATAPTTYFGNASQKTSDNTRRYLGSILTDASGNVLPFYQDGMAMYYQNGFAGAAPYRALSAGTATTSTSVSLSGIIPVTASSVMVRIALTNTDATHYSANIQQSVGSNVFTNANPSSIFNGFIPIASQAIAYYYTGGTPTGGGMYVDVTGYAFKR